MLRGGARAGWLVVKSEEERRGSGAYRQYISSRASAACHVPVLVLVGSTVAGGTWYVVRHVR